MKSIINYKAITSYSISYMQKRENMTVLVKFVCVMIIFLSLCVFSMHIESTPFFLSFSIFLINLYIIFYFLLVTSFYYFIIAAVTTCIYDSDCPEDMCYPPKKSFCSTFEILSIERKVGVCECI